MPQFLVPFGPITFGETDSDGDRFVIRDIVGWTGIPIDAGIVERPHADGAVIAYVRYKARPLVLQGFGIAATPIYVWRMREKLEAAVTNALSDTTLTVPEADGDRSLTVRAVETMRIRLLGNRAVEFEIPLIAADPVKT